MKVKYKIQNSVVERITWNQIKIVKKKLTDSLSDWNGRQHLTHNLPSRLADTQI